MKTPNLLLLAMPLAAAAAWAGTERVTFPDGFATDFVRYEIVDRDDRNIARFMYMNRDAWAAAEAGEPLPDGSIVVMEDHTVEMQKEDTPERDADGRLIPTEETTNVFVMQKGKGWGDEYAEALRNGDWEYAWFSPDGVRSDKDLTGCFECHKGQADADFTFTAYDAIAARE